MFWAEVALVAMAVDVLLMLVVAGVGIRLSRKQLQKMGLSALMKPTASSSGRVFYTVRSEPKGSQGAGA